MNFQSLRRALLTPILSCTGPSVHSHSLPLPRPPSLRLVSDGASGPFSTVETVPPTGTTSTETPTKTFTSVVPNVFLIYTFTLSSLPDSNGTSVVSPSKSPRRSSGPKPL